MRLSEQIFDLSTETSSEIIKLTKENFTLRFLLVIYFVKKILDCIPESTLIMGKFEFLEYCLHSWNRFEPDEVQLSLEKLFTVVTRKKDDLEEIMAHILQKNNSSKKISELLVGIHGRLNRPDDISSILFSQLHMTFNRGGIYPMLEKKAYPLIEGMIIDENR